MAGLNWGLLDPNLPERIASAPDRQRQVEMQNALAQAQLAHSRDQSALSQYTLSKARDNAESLAQMQQQIRGAGGPADIRTAVDAMMQHAIRTGDSTALEHITKLRQMVQVDDLMKSGGGADSPEMVRRLNLLSLSHPTAGTAAKNMETRLQNTAGINAMRSQPAGLSAGEMVPGTTQQAVQDIPPEDMKAALTVAQSKVPIRPGIIGPQPGDVSPLRTGTTVLTSLMKSESPGIANAAKALQAQIDSGTPGMDPTHINAQIQHLVTMDAGRSERQMAREQNQADRVAFRTQFPTATPAPMAVLGPDGKPTYVSRQDAVGQAPVPRMGGMATGITSENAHLKGDEFISTLDPQMAQNVKALTNYTAPLSTFSTRTGDRAVMLAMAKQADPNFDEKKYPARSALVKDFTAGKSADNIVNLDQGISHMGTLLKLSDALGNSDPKPLNAVINYVRDNFSGADNVNNFKTAKQAVGTELMRVFRQVNASEVETKAWEERFSEANSQIQLKGAIKTGAELLNGRLKALNQKWDKGMETNTGYPNLLSPSATAALRSFGVTPPGTELKRRASDSAGIPDGWTVKAR